MTTAHARTGARATSTANSGAQRSAGADVPGASPAGTRGPGRPRAGGEDKRERILTEAFALFAEHGYSATSLSAIAGAAEISKAGLLHHFDSKAALFSAVLERRDVLDTARFSDDAGPWAPIEAFLGVVERNRRTPAAVGLYLALAVEGAQADNPAHRWLHRHFDSAVDTIAAGLDRGKEEGAVRPEAPSLELARTLVAAADGFQLQWLCSRADEAIPSDPGAPQSHPGLDMTSQLRLLIDLIRQRWELSDAGPAA